MSIFEELESIRSQLNQNSIPKLLFVVPESAGDIFLSTSLLPSLRETYCEYEIYFACKPLYRDILKDNPYITKVINYIPIMDNQIFMEGTADWHGIFDISIMVTIFTQRLINYLNNGKTRIGLNLKCT